MGVRCVLGQEGTGNGVGEAEPRGARQKGHLRFMHNSWVKKRVIHSPNLDPNSDRLRTFSE